MKYYVRNINEYKNQNNALFNYEIKNNSVVLTKYIGTESNPEVPVEIEGYPVEVIGANCFELNKYVINIILPNTIKEVQNFGFNNCINLKSIILPNSILYIGKFSLSNCKKLKSVILPNHLIGDISEGILYNCIELEELILPNTVKGINQWAFGYCDKLEEIIIPKSVEWIHDSVFYHDISLKRLSIKNPKIKLTGDYLFRDCYNLKIETLDQLTQDILNKNGITIKT